uniref:Uncharacterized protein n=1 Tax=Cannabis sativa TaxID=3483 RepID=A0A803QYK0_CANSA
MEWKRINFHSTPLFGWILKVLECYSNGMTFPPFLWNDYSISKGVERPFRCNNSFFFLSIFVCILNLIPSLFLFLFSLLFLYFPSFQHNVP